MGCPGSMSTTRCTRLLLEIWSFSVYFSGRKRSLLHPNTAQPSFFPLQSSTGARKYLTKCAHAPPGHPIILLKSTLFNMAAVSVKRSILANMKS